MNTFSCGLDTEILNPKFRKFRIFGKNVPYVLGTVISMLTARPVDYEIEIDGEKLDGRYSEVLLGNGCVIGGTIYYEEKPEIQDGRATFLMEKGRWGFRHIPVYLAAGFKKFDKLKKYVLTGEGEHITIRRADGEKFSMTFDGETGAKKKEWNASVVKQGLLFVLPMEGGAIK